MWVPGLAKSGWQTSEIGARKAHSGADAGRPPWDAHVHRAPGQGPAGLTSAVLPASEAVASAGVPRGQSGAVSLSRDSVLGSVVGSVAQGRGAAAGCGDGGAEPGGAGRRLVGLRGPGRAQVAELVGIGRVGRRAGSTRGARGWWPVSRHKGLVVRGAGGGEAHGGQARGHGAALATGPWEPFAPASSDGGELGAMPLWVLGAP